MYKRAKTAEGLIICQAENNHITIRDHGKLVCHIECNEDKTINEMLEMWHEVQNQFEDA